MVESVNSGYKEAATAAIFAGTQDINTAAEGEWVSLSDAIDNSVVNYLYADFQVELDLAAFTGGAASVIQLYLLPSVDGIVYPDWVDNVITDQPGNDQYLIATFTTNSTAADQVMTAQKIEMPPGSFKLGVRNKTGAALTATSNVVRYRRWGFASA